MTPSVLPAELPTLRSEGLELRAFSMADAIAVQTLASDQLIADTTASIPHPYPDGEAERWIGTHGESWQAREGANYAITLSPSGEVVGAIGLMEWQRDEAELGYWVGVPYWGRGIATAAARSVVEFAVERLGLHRLHARALTRNPASCKVLLRVGFSHTGSAPSVCGYRRLEQSTEYYELRVK